jgi:magnesium chelatase accessory protein
VSLRAARGQPSWEEDGGDWPNRDASRFVETGALRWHFQRMGRGPALLLVHGTAAATHSWRGLAPLLARRFDVLAPDLPGHGFTDPLPSGALSLPGMARALKGLLRQLAFEPVVVVGHSAGAAILARLCIDRAIAPRLLISLNGALLPFEGMAGHLFPPMARLLFLNPFAPRLFAWSADRDAVARLLRGTGSTIDRRGVELYARLMRRYGHVAGALGMMANWDLDALARDLPRLSTRVALLAARGDKAVAPAAAEKACARLPDARVEFLAGVGHLAHEEKPEEVADRIFELAAEIGADAAR